MKSLREAVRNVMMRERPVRMLEREMKENGNVAFDIFLNKGTEYVVRARIARGTGAARLTLTETSGAPVPVFGGVKANYFTAIPEKDGFYRVESNVDGVDKGKGATLIISLHRTCPAQGYVKHQSVLPAYLETATEKDDAYVTGKEAAVPVGMTGAFGPTRA